MWIIFRMVTCYIWHPSRLNTGADYVPCLCERHTAVLDTITSPAKLFADDTKIYQQRDK